MCDAFNRTACGTECAKPLQCATEHGVAATQARIAVVAQPRDFSSIVGRLDRELTDEANARVRNVRSLQAQIDAIARGDLESFLVNAHEDATLDIYAPPEFPWIRHAKGPGELRRAIEQNFGSVEDQTPELTNVVTEGDTVILFGRERGRVRATGQSYDMEFVQRYQFRDGRL